MRVDTCGVDFMSLGFFLQRQSRADVMLRDKPWRDNVSQRDMPCSFGRQRGEWIESFNTLCNKTAPVFNRVKINELVVDCCCTSTLIWFIFVILIIFMVIIV